MIFRIHLNPCPAFHPDITATSPLELHRSVLVFADGLGRPIDLLHHETLQALTPDGWRDIGKIDCFDLQTWCRDRWPEILAAVGGEDSAPASVTGCVVVDDDGEAD